MEKSVRKLYKEAIKNELFKTQLRDSGEEYWSPSIFWDVVTKSIYAAVYQGWLTARGEFKDSNY